MHMRPAILNPTSAYARLAWPNHPSKTKLDNKVLIAQHHSLCMTIHTIRKLGWLCIKSYNQGLGLNPWFHLHYFTYNSNLCPNSQIEVIRDWYQPLAICECRSPHMQAKWDWSRKDLLVWMEIRRSLNFKHVGNMTTKKSKGYHNLHMKKIIYINVYNL